MGSKMRASGSWLWAASRGLKAGAGRDLESYQQLLTQAFNRGGKPVRLLGIGVRLLDLSGGNEQLEFSW